MSFMKTALEAAAGAAEAGEVPVGAVISDAAGNVIAVAGNQVEALGDASAHAEILAMRAAALAIGSKFLSDCTLTVTLEPCAMCAGAIAAFRVKKLVFGAYDPKSGGVEHGPRVLSQPTTHWQPEIIGGVRDSESSALLAAFFAGLRHAGSDS
jgi:tRNA(Arg) A34 adenosine deaminase TadA